MNKRGAPFVFLGFRSPVGTSIAIDRERGADLGTAHLLELGHRRVGHVSTMRPAEPALVADLGRLDVLVNNAGMNQRAEVFEKSPEGWAVD